jgi:hypothetical protein
MDLARRCDWFLQTAGHFQTLEVGEGQSVGARLPNAETRLTIAEIYIAPARTELKAYDFLVFAALRGEDGGCNTVVLAGPDTLRSRMKVFGAGIGMFEISLGPISTECTDAAVILYGIRRERRLRLILSALEHDAAALDYDRDPLGSATLAEALLDRLEVLCSAGGCEAMLAGSWGLSVHAAVLPRHFAIMREQVEAEPRQFWVKEGRLHTGRSIETAIPARMQDFILLRIGSEADKSGEQMSIDQLRRQLSLAGGGFLGKQQREQVDLYLTREHELRQNRRFVSVFGRLASHRIPAVTPIALEIAPDIPAFSQAEEGTLTPRFQSLLNSMREGLRYNFGPEIPQIRVRANFADMPLGSYLFMLREIPIVMGTIQPDKRWCSETPERLRLLNIEAELCTIHSTRAEGSWVAQADWQRVIDAGMELHFPESYVVDHLRAVLSRNLSEIIGVEWVAGSLGRRVPVLLAKFRSAPGGLTRFCDVLRALLAEMVPVRDLKAIAERYLELAGWDSIMDIVEEMRLLDSIRPHLPGNRPGTSIFRFGKKFTELLESCIVRDATSAVLAMVPEPCQKALSAVRSDLGSWTTQPVGDRIGVVENWRLRPFARLLLELEFPHVHILAERELIDILSMQLVGTIEL